MLDYLSMQEPVDRIDSYRLEATPVHGTKTVEWRSTQNGRVVAVTSVAPRGRKGLWDAMARAATCSSGDATTFPTHAALAVEPVGALPAPVLVLAPGLTEEHNVDAHLDYLSRLSEPVEVDGPVASVVSLAEFAASRGTRRGRQG